MRRFVVWFLALLMMVGLTVAAGCGGGEEAATPGSLAAVMEAGKIVVGTSADYPPFEFVDENGNYDGFDIALMAEIASRLGVELEWKDMDFSILTSAVQQGKIDAIIACMTATEDRDLEVDFTIPYYNSGDGVLIKKGTGIELAAIEDIKDYKVGVQTGTIHEEWVNENLVSAGTMDESNLFTFDRVDRAIMDLENGQLDIVIIDLAAAKKFMMTKDLELVMDVDLSGGDPAIAIREGSAQLQEALNEIIQDLIDEGFIDELERTHILSAQ